MLQKKKEATVCFGLLVKKKGKHKKWRESCNRLFFLSILR